MRAHPWSSTFTAFTHTHIQHDISVWAPQVWKGGKFPQVHLLINIPQTKCVVKRSKVLLLIHGVCRQVRLFPLPVRLVDEVDF